MISLHTLRDRIDKRIAQEENDITPKYLPNQREIRTLSNLALDIIIRDFEDIKKAGQLRKLKKTQVVFESTIKAVNDDIKKHGFWSFWHYAAICSVTCFAYLKLLKQNKHHTIELNKEDTWVDANWEVAVLSINFVSAELFKEKLSILLEINQSDDVDIRSFCEILLKKIERLSK